MLQLFRRNLFAFNLFLLLYCIALRFSWFFITPDIDVTIGRGVLSALIYQWVGSDSLTIKIASILLLMFHAVQINRLVALNRLTEENTLFAGLFYILLSCLTLEFIPLSPQVLANTFIILMCLEIFKPAKSGQSQLETFNLGFWIALASMFYAPYVLYLVLGLIAMFVLRPVKLLDIVRAITGFLLAYFLLGTTLFLAGDLSRLWFDHWSVYPRNILLL